MKKKQLSYGIFAIVTGVLTLLSVMGCDKNEEFYTNDSEYTLAERMMTRSEGGGISMYNRALPLGSKNLPFMMGVGQVRYFVFNVTLLANDNLTSFSCDAKPSYAFADDCSSVSASATEIVSESDSLYVKLDVNISFLYKNSYQYTTSFRDLYSRSAFVK